MYYLTGKVRKMDKNFAILDAGGIGYQVRLTKRLAKTLSVGQDREEILVLQVNVHHKEPIMFGFASPKERCLFSLFIEESILTIERAFKLVSEGGDDLVRMLREQDVEALRVAAALQEFDLTEARAWEVIRRMQYMPFDIAQKEIMDCPSPRKIISIKEEENRQVTAALYDADGNSLVDQAIQAMCQLRNLKPKQAEPFVTRAMQELDADGETPVTDIIKRANKAAQAVGE